jgi:hypothetical protein
MKRVMTFTIATLSLLFMSSCGSIGKMIERQNKAAQIVKNKTYDISLDELREKTIEYFGGWRSVNPNERAKRIKEEIDKGFVYNKQYYQKYEPGLLDFIGALSSSEKDSVEKYFTKANYHTIEDTGETFKFVFDGMIFEGKKVDDNSSKIKVLSFSEIERGPYQLSVNWIALLDKHRGLFSIRKGPVLLNKSMKYSNRDQITEIDLFKHIAPEEYEQL